MGHRGAREQRGVQVGWQKGVQRGKGRVGYRGARGGCRKGCRMGCRGVCKGMMHKGVQDEARRRGARVHADRGPGGWGVQVQG